MTKATEHKVHVKEWSIAACVSLESALDTEHAMGSVSRRGEELMDRHIFLLRHIL